MTSDQKFIINGVSSDSVDIWVDYLPVPPMAQQRYTIYSAGADEDSTVPDDAFADITYTIDFHTFLRETYDNTDIYAFLANAKTLAISKLPDFYFKVRKVGGIIPRTLLGMRNDYGVTFTLAPFKYRANDEEFTPTSGTIIENTGTRYCKPTIKADIFGTALISVNGQALSVTANGASIVIDSEKFLCYDSSGRIITNATAGIYPMLAVGQNAIAFSGDISNVRIKKNERCY